MSEKPPEYGYACNVKEATRLEAQAKAVEMILKKEPAFLGLKQSAC
ncbi:MAG TPA: hypothetical protein VEH86_02000 [Candidatus Acidoferrum sp.]|nr:hypothetical protein [Candidatus Acidoferrum sp.]